MNQPAATSESAAAETISRHTRRQAIEDGDLVDVSLQATEVGIRIPTAVTRAVWADSCEWTKADELRSRSPSSGQSTDGRLWDVLWMARVALTMEKDGSGDQRPLRYTVLRKPRPGHGRKRKVTLKIHVGPGDAGEPVATITQPNED